MNDFRIHGRARAIASYWHGGQSSPLYALASAGTVPARWQAEDLFAEIAKIDGGTDRDFLAWYVAARMEGRLTMPEWPWRYHVHGDSITRRPVWVKVLGGHSYGCSERQPFTSIAAATAFIRDPSPRWAFPCWGEWSSPHGEPVTVGLVYMGDYTQDYPDRRIVVGPRGGLSVESC